MAQKFYFGPPAYFPEFPALNTCLLCSLIIHHFVIFAAKKTQLRYDMDSGGEMSLKGSDTGKSGDDKKKKKKGMCKH